MGAALASATALWIAYVAYPVQKEQDRQFKIQEEMRAAIGALISALEVFASKVNGSNAVGRKTVPYFVAEIASVKSALGMIYALNLKALGDAAFRYESEIKNWRKLILVAKKKRPEEMPNGRRPPDYAEAMRRVDEHYLKVKDARAEFFSQASVALDIEQLVVSEIEPLTDEIDTAADNISEPPE